MKKLKSIIENIRLYNLLIIILVFTNSFIGLSQEKLNPDLFIIITYKFDRTNDNHPAREFYWIAPINSNIYSKSFNFYPLYFDEFSYEDLKECKEQKDINVFTMYSEENFILEKSFGNDITYLKEMVKSNKKKVQTSVKKWNTGEKEKVEVYITPVFGNFCSSNIAKQSGKEINYEGIIFLPLSKFKLNMDFFKTEEGKIIEKSDYLKNIFFSKIN